MIDDSTRASQIATSDSDNWLFNRETFFSQPLFYPDPAIETVTIAREDIKNSTKFKDYIFQTIYHWSLVNGKPVTTLSQAYQFNAIWIIVGLIFMGVVFILGYDWLLHFLGGAVVFCIWFMNSLRLRFYKNLLEYFNLKDQVIERAWSFEKKVSDDIIDPSIVPTQVGEIGNLINELASTSRYLDDTLTKLHSSSIYFNKKTFSNIETFLNIEIWWFRKFFTYILSLIKKWLEWHKEELNEEYFRLEKQIRDIESTNPELASTLELSNERFKQHIETTEKVITRI